MIQIKNMNDLINAVRDFLTADRQAGEIAPTLNGGDDDVIMGHDSKKHGIPLTSYPYILLDDGGERTELINGNTQKRYYRVEVELMTMAQSEEETLSAILQFSSQVKASFEKIENRFLDGMIFGVSITPLLFEDDQSRLYRGRRVAVEYFDLEDVFEQH